MSHIKSAKTFDMCRIAIRLPRLSVTTTEITRPEPKMLESSSKERVEMSASAQTMLRDYAGVRWPSMNHKGRIARLAGELGLGHRRVRSLYQNEPGVSLRADEMQRIAALRNDKAEEANRNEFQDLQARLARIEAALFAQDEEFHSGQMAAFRAAVDGRRGNDEPDAARSTD